MLNKNDKLYDIKHHGVKSMSVVVAVCGLNYAFIISDGRVVKYSADDGIDIVDENTSKIIMVNENICIGVTGDYKGLVKIKELFSSTDNIILDFPDIVELIYDDIKDVELGLLPINILITGKAKNGVFSVVEMKSDNGYKPTIYVPTASGQHVVRCALPIFKDEQAANNVTERINKLTVNTHTLDELKVKVSNLIRNIAGKNDTVNRNIFSEIIT